MQQALEREGWNAEQWDAWREKRLAYVLNKAATSAETEKTDNDKDQRRILCPPTPDVEW